MARIIPPGFAEARYILRATGDSRPWTVTLGHQVDAYAGDYQLAANACADNFLNAIVPGLHTSVTFEGVDLVVGTDGGDPFVYSSTGFTGNGQTSSNMLPQNCALLVQKRSLFSGKRNRGRMYVPLIVREAQVDNVGVIDGTELADYQAAFNAWYNLLTDEDNIPGPLSPVILHTAGAGFSGPPTAIASFRCDNVIATQRKRLRS